MAIPILSISFQPEDAFFGSRIAKIHGLPFYSSNDPKEIHNRLLSDPQTIVFWNADLHKTYLNQNNPGALQTINRLLVTHSKPNKVFMITEKPLSESKHIYDLGIKSFGHHLLRRYEDPAPELCSKIIGAALTPFPFGLDRYMPAEAQTRMITLKESKHRAIAVQAVKNTLTNNGVSERLSVQVTNALEELLLNAIFDAPADERNTQYRKGKDLQENIVFSDKEKIELTISNSQSYLGLSVSDSFGTLKKEVVLNIIRQNFKESSYEPDANRKSGLGINGLVQSGFSLLFVCKPGSKTEVMLFFPRVKNYKEFKKSFRFLSLLF
jgi:hypothetical protein